MNTRQFLFFAVILVSFSCNNSGKRDKHISYNSKAVAEQEIIRRWNSLAVQLERKNDLLRSLVKTDIHSPAAKKDSLRRAVNSFSLFTMHNIDDEQEIKNNIEGLVIQQNEINELMLSWNKDAELARSLFIHLEGAENRIIMAIRDYNEYVGAFNSAYSDKKKEIYFPRMMDSAVPVKFE